MAATTEWRKKNPQKAQECRNNYVQERVNYINDYKFDHGCFYCNIKDPLLLCFHHTEDNKEHNVSHLKYSSFNKLKAEIEKCQVLCQHCHLKLHAGRLS